ncbi:MAG: MarR family winged helix-turn-helix transcriptional regulator [Methylovulum sp.]|nr:MarR family winged helix-turn-helix transcriptional regulator [Methylovulum sp.]
MTHLVDPVVVTPDFECCKDCIGFNLRKATRAVSQFYDELLRPIGIRSTQYSLLVYLHMSGSITVTQLADNVVMDRTTLTRNLNVLEKEKFVTVISGLDRRTRLVTITQDGLVILDKAYPLWYQAQSRIKGAMSEAQLNGLLDNLSALVKAVQPNETLKN